MNLQGFFPLAAGVLLSAACTGNIQGPSDEGNPGSGATPSGAGATGSGASGGSMPATGGKGSNGKGGSTGSGGSSNASGGTNSGGGTGGSSAGAPASVFGGFSRLTQAEYAATVLAALGVEADLAVIPVDGRIGQFTSNASVSPDPVHPYLLAAEDLAESLIPAEFPACEADRAEQCLE
ncbi:MAG TPA: DUF1587 domain-containing protein, partial [Polyangiaceae bacterium]